MGKMGGELVIIGIIGAGASGMAAALAASEAENTEVVLIERQARVGKKLLATGNGRCNLSNLFALQQGYHGEDAGFSRAALNCYPPEETLAWFRSLGLFTVSEASGRVYPFSDHANSVVDVLRLNIADRKNISLLTGKEVCKVRRDAQGFWLDDETRCDRLIIACGGLAGTKLGGSLSGYKLLAKFGHRSTKLRPSLVQIKTKYADTLALKGVRAECNIKILHNNEAVKENAGEVQFTEIGLSGPVIFEISRDVCMKAGHWEACLDLLPGCSESDLFAELQRRRSTGLSVDELLTGVLHNRLGRVLVKAAGISNHKLVSDLSDRELQDVCSIVKGWRIAFSEPLDMSAAQVTAGGVRTDDFDPFTMESKLVPGLYACGEVLDVDGDCGGYNLQWAWSSGRLAGTSAGKGAL